MPLRVTRAASPRHSTRSAIICTLGAWTGNPSTLQGGVSVYGLGKSNRGGWSNRIAAAPLRRRVDSMESAQDALFAAQAGAAFGGLARRFHHARELGVFEAL